MFRTIHRLLRKEDGQEENASGNVSGFLTREDARKLRDSRMRPANPHRKKSYKTWVCMACRNKFYYAVLRCPLCGPGSNITEVVNQTKHAHILGYGNAEGRES